MGSTTFGIDQLQFLTWVCGFFIVLIMGLCWYGIVVINDRDEIHKTNLRLSRDVVTTIGQLAKMRRDDQASRDHINALRKYINKATPGGWIGYMRSLDGEDITIYADYKEIKDADLTAALPLAEYDRAIKDATARLQVANAS
jgi:hypothetical protein